MKKIKVLHVVNSLGVGGIETWLRNVVRQKNDGIQNDFLVLRQTDKSYSKEISDYGSFVYGPVIDENNLTHLSKYSVVRQKISAFLEKHSYDVIHVHVYGIAGFVLKIAFKLNVPVRIAHCHTANKTNSTGRLIGLLQQVKTLINRKMILSYATDILACSEESGIFYVGKSVWSSDSRCRVVYCGIALDEFKKYACLQNNFKALYNIPEDAIVIGHVGNMESGVKNQSFFLKICKELSLRDKRYYFFLGGYGKHYEELKNFASLLGIEKRVVMPGFCNTSQVMSRVFDAFVLPSLREGLPLVVLEATAAGLFSVCSNVITKDLIESSLKDRIQCLSLLEEKQVWVDCIENAVKNKIPVIEGLKLLENSCFTIESSISQLYSLYSNRLDVSVTSSINRKRAK